jgi:hypothetical protein
MKMEVESYKDMDEYEIKSCADTVLKAQKIMADEKKWPKVQKELESRKEAIENLTGVDKLKAKANKRREEMDYED